jgi:nucleoid-associated protein YgaU
MAKKVTTTEPTNEEPVSTGNSFFEYLKSGESYTSLILGIVVVIISTALLLSFVHNRNSVPSNQNPATQEAPQSIAQISQKALQLTVTPQPTATGTVDDGAAVTGPTATTAPTARPTTQPTSKPTAKPTETKKAQAKVTPTKAPAKQTAPAGEYTVKAGDTLWSIAERHYNSGYNWVDIARTNKLSNPGQLTVNQKLKLPKTTAKAPTTKDAKKEVAQKNTTTEVKKITGDSYTVVKGDNLWTIAVRAYGDGYKWTEIAKANKLANPNVIHANNKLKLSRGK